MPGDTDQLRWGLHRSHHERQQLRRDRLVWQRWRNTWHVVRGRQRLWKRHLLRGLPGESDQLRRYVHRSSDEPIVLRGERRLQCKRRNRGNGVHQRQRLQRRIVQGVVPGDADQLRWGMHRSQDEPLELRRQRHVQRE